MMNWFLMFIRRVEIVKPIISSRMKNAIPLLIPVEVEMNTGATAGSTLVISDLLEKRMFISV